LENPADFPNQFLFGEIRAEKRHSSYTQQLCTMAHSAQKKSNALKLKRKSINFYQKN
jgi:hypothetical protein